MNAPKGQSTPGAIATVGLRKSFGDTVGISSRVRMVLVHVADGLAIPNWTLDEAAEQPEHPWRYPE